MNKYFKYILVLIVVLFLGTAYVNAANSCDNSQYQCIMCKYQATGVNAGQYITFYAQADGNGGAKLITEATGAGYITWSFGVPASAFINDAGTGLKCSDKVSVEDTHCGNKMCYSVSIGGEHISTIVDSSNNGKNFKNTSSTQQTTYCKDVPIYILGAGVKGTGSTTGMTAKNYTKASVTATVVKNGDGTYDLELPATYNKASSDWNNVSSSLINNCNSSIIVTCYSSEQTGYQSSQTIYHCSLNTTSSLESRTEVDSSGKPTESTLPSTTPVVTPSVGNQTCTSLLGNPSDQGTPAYYLTQAFKIMRYVAIVLLAVLSVMDFIEATASQDSDAISKAVNKTIKRLVLCVIIFLLPSLIEFILTLLSERAASICID